MMIDFNAMAERANERKLIETRLNELGVPGEGITWKRIFDLAASYETKYKQRALELLFNPPDTLHEPKEALADISELPPIDHAFTLSEDQQKAWKKLVVWSKNEEPYFILRGFAGTGKSFLMKMLKTLDVSLFFTAPTNKATKVLSRFVETEAKTTFSQLGLRMSADDDKLVMEYGATNPYLPKGGILVVDEASMIGRQLYEFIDETQKRTRCKVLYVGDPAQLPPVGEKTTKAWKCTSNKVNIATLRKVMRYDNQLLALATRIRDLMKEKNYNTFPIQQDNADGSGVFILSSKKAFLNKIKEFKSSDDFTQVKVIAWRNKAVDRYNNLIRENLGFTDTYNVGDILLLAEPIEKDDVIIGHVDDEYRVIDIYESVVRTSCKTDIPVYRVRAENEDGVQTLDIPVDRVDLDQVLLDKSIIARAAKGIARRDAWKDFWDTKKLFAATRYGYSLTAHRAQGSSYLQTFIDQQDILSNSNGREAYKCLYVASTRASQSLYTF